jgi:hypothetical protein
MHWLNDMPLATTRLDRWGSYDRASCPGIDGKEAEREAVKADLAEKIGTLGSILTSEIQREEAKQDAEAEIDARLAEPLKIKLHTSAEGVEAAKEFSEYSWGQSHPAMRALASATKHAEETAHVTAVIIRPIPKGNAINWRCDFCLAGDE